MKCPPNDALLYRKQSETIFQLVCWEVMAVSSPALFCTQVSTLPLLLATGISSHSRAGPGIPEEADLQGWRDWAGRCLADVNSAGGVRHREGGPGIPLLKHWVSWELWTGDWERASWLEGYNLVHQEGRVEHVSMWGWESKQGTGTEEEGSFKQLVWGTHRGGPGTMETRPLKLEQHSLSCTNAEVRDEPVPQTSKPTIQEPIKPSFMWWTTISFFLFLFFFCWLTT